MWHLKGSLNQLQIGRRGGDWYKRIQYSMRNSRKVELKSLLINCIWQCSERKTSLVHNEEKQHSTTQKPLAGITNTLDYWTWIPNDNLAQDRAECRPYAYHAGNLMCLWNFIRWRPSTIRTYCQVRFKCHIMHQKWLEQSARYPTMHFKLVTLAAMAEGTVYTLTNDIQSFTSEFHRSTPILSLILNVEKQVR